VSVAEDDELIGTGQAVFTAANGPFKGACASWHDGEHEYVAGARVDSIHTVWMELHEDHLQSLGISREEEGS
jgi:hypothetical protein